jgi:hypothetical protein
MKVKDCKYCGKSFMPKSGKQVYCSPACKVNDFRKNTLAKAKKVPELIREKVSLQESLQESLHEKESLQQSLQVTIQEKESLQKELREKLKREMALPFKNMFGYPKFNNEEEEKAYIEKEISRTAKLMGMSVEHYIEDLIYRLKTAYPNLYKNYELK